MNTLLIIFSTWNRPGLTGLCLHNLLKNKSPDADLLVIDNHSEKIAKAWWRAFDVVPEFKPPERQYHQHRLLRFLDSSYEYLITIESDTLVDVHFDQSILRAWRACGNPDLPATGYHSRLHTVLQITEHYWIMRYLPGLCQFYTRKLALQAYDHIQQANGWRKTWDTTLAQRFTEAVAPPQSVVQHLGIFEGVNSDENNISTDYADDFQGSLSVGIKP